MCDEDQSELLDHSSQPLATPATCKSFEPKGQWERVTRITTADTFLKRKDISSLSRTCHMQFREHHRNITIVHWTKGAIVLSTARSKMVVDDMQAHNVPQGRDLFVMCSSPSSLIDRIPKPLSFFNTSVSPASKP